MSMSILGDDFDLHGGGDDLTFPHHQNEEAQAAAAGHSFARLWMHSAMLNVSGEKMSKSLGNFTTLAEALDAHDPRAMRLAVLQVHYRSTMELGPTALAAAEEAIHRLDAMVRRVRGRVALDGAIASGDEDALDEHVVARFNAAMDDDMSTPTAVDALFGATRAANSALDNDDVGAAHRLAATVMALASVLGLVIGAEDSGLSDEVLALAKERDQARANRDFAMADKIRDKLMALGYQVMDTPDGTVVHA
jgi:cysteinyl-tRNA synthetase